jgi:hypothetical protein
MRLGTCYSTTRCDAREAATPLRAISSSNMAKIPPLSVPTALRKSSRAEPRIGSSGYRQVVPGTRGLESFIFGPTVCLPVRPHPGFSRMAPKYAFPDLGRLATPVKCSPEVYTWPVLFKITQGIVVGQMSLHEGSAVTDANGLSLETKRTRFFWHSV